MEFYGLGAERLNGTKESMEKYKGKTIVVVNTASECGLTPQYEGLEELYQKYNDKGLVILGFPCNQFGNQEPGSAEDIQKFCKVNYGVTFPLFAKIEVNGKGAHPIFKFLKSELSGLLGGKIKWNFTKFVIDKTGKPVKRFGPTAEPDSMTDFIEKIL
ncbi:glutathione peroxidase [Flagellimonas crocea]|uniref:glutathione peroxidase n=1 Tax=Flagellimonas crocea TaxID=3067311 RepID=UPI00296FFD39|nr:glutathione peroxidase [Muricauda sp. DH64]